MKSRRIFDARQVPEDELEGVRQALEEAGIDYYETSAGNWGLGNAALWATRPEDVSRARQVVGAFQDRWTREARSSRHRLPPTRWALVPVAIAAIAMIAWLSWQLSRW